MNRTQKKIVALDIAMYLVPIILVAAGAMAIAKYIWSC